MISSAKMTAITFLATAALGAAVFTGCTVTSGTVDDTDGGTQNNDDKDAGPSDDPDAGEPTPDATAPVCETKQDSDFVSAECQACLDSACCDTLKTCFDIPGDPDEGQLDCNQYSECLSECGEKPDGERDACYDDCDLVAAPGVVDAYGAIEMCGSASCATDCGLE